MKKLTWMFVLLSLLVVGCRSDSDDTQAQMDTYKALKDRLINNNGNTTYNIPFNTSLAVERDENDNYVYVVTIDKPQIVMKHLNSMALIPTQVKNDKIEPCLGIFDEKEYSFVPNQKDEEKGVIEGFVLSGNSDSATFDVYILLAWMKDDNATPQNIFITYHVVDGVVQDSGVQDE